ncbi:MAG: hypothetical protein A2126_02255 [Candidatus Woykebacteria bacterium GWB1_45_5]|uniref:Fimbrial assembly protein n=2 Tax=Candidatus Woykeibacteriota TaxID=1817899 RepID=A0A1G1W327_9BACT|nr:MAG: hypothetical protein A2113_02675 [Candidatus Woykebacteria bacterium GWA1_44_8]OGY23953.1 MAG: hypothetical protein A2126_02255 [Candidatus Woykebacteria bacterium GWB1_45_5]
MSLLPLFNKSSAKNINLLPEEEVAALFVKRDLILALSIPAATLILLVVVFVGLFLFEAGQKLRRADLAKKINQTTQEWQKYADTAATVVQINTDLKTYQATAEKNKGFHDNLVAIRDIVPSSVVLSKIDLSAAGEATVGGSATDPKDVYQFIDILKKKGGPYSGVSLKNVSYSASDNTYKFSVSFVVAVK